VLGVGLEVVERLTRFINVPFMEVHGFCRRQSHILRAEGYVSLRIMRTVCAPRLVNLHTLIFDPNI
jgi:hypothetical protein